jgi:hypothetical protein
MHGLPRGTWHRLCQVWPAVDYWETAEGPNGLHYVLVHLKDDSASMKLLRDLRLTVHFYLGNWGEQSSRIDIEKDGLVGVVTSRGEFSVHPSELRRLQLWLPYVVENPQMARRVQL